MSFMRQLRMVVSICSLGFLAACTSRTQPDPLLLKYDFSYRLIDGGRVGAIQAFAAADKLYVQFEGSESVPKELTFSNGQKRVPHERFGTYAVMGRPGGDLKIRIGRKEASVIRATSIGGRGDETPK